jgi:hypothetical protein
MPPQGRQALLGSLVGITRLGHGHLSYGIVIELVALGRFDTRRGEAGSMEVLRPAQFSTTSEHGNVGLTALGKTYQICYIRP